MLVWAKGHLQFLLDSLHLPFPFFNSSLPRSLPPYPSLPPYFHPISSTFQTSFPAHRKCKQREGRGQGDVGVVRARILVISVEISDLVDVEHALPLLPELGEA